MLSFAHCLLATIAVAAAVTPPESEDFCNEEPSELLLNLHRELSLPDDTSNLTRRQNNDIGNSKPIEVSVNMHVVAESEEKQADFPVRGFIACSIAPADVTIARSLGTTDRYTKQRLQAISDIFLPPNHHPDCELYLDPWD